MTTTNSSTGERVNRSAGNKDSLERVIDKQVRIFAAWTVLGVVICSLLAFGIARLLQ